MMVDRQSTTVPNTSNVSALTISNRSAAGWAREPQADIPSSTSAPAAAAPLITLTIALSCRMGRFWAIMTKAAHGAARRQRRGAKGSPPAFGGVWGEAPS